MSKKNEKTTMKARKVTLSVLDASLIFSLWGKGSLERNNVRMAVEVNDTFETFLEEHDGLLKAAAPNSGTDEQREAAMGKLIETTGEFTLSGSAFDSVRQAVKDHKGWTMRGARQLLRIEDAFEEAEWIDLEPRKVEDAKEA